jgi:hypothetical protein
MGTVRRFLPILVVLAFAAVASAKRAATAKVIGLDVQHRITPSEGFIDVATADDGAGVIAYVIADAATRAEVHLVDVATHTELRSIDVSGLTLAPRRIWLVGRGDQAQLVVVGPQGTDEGDAAGVVGAVWDASGKRRFGIGPADAIAVVERKGKPELITRTVVPAKVGEVVQIQRYHLKNGKKNGKPKKLALVDGKNAKLGFRVNHWTDDGTVAVGTKDGGYDRRQDIRKADVEGRVIDDLRAHARGFQVLAAEGGAPVFARVATDQTGIEVWRDDVRTEVTLDGFERYDPKSLVWTTDDDGKVWVGLATDPWNRAAVNRRKQDLAYFDVFRVDGATANRVGQVLAPDRRFALGATGKRVWLLEHNAGFRGGKELTIYGYVP